MVPLRHVRHLQIVDEHIGMQSDGISQLRELSDVFLPLGAPLGQVLVPACERSNEEDTIVI